MSSWLRPTKFHHMTSCSVNGAPPKQQRPGRAVARVVQRQDVATGALKRQVRDIERGARHLEAALVQQHAVLEGRLDVERDARAGVEIDLSAEQRCEGVHW